MNGGTQKWPWQMALAIGRWQVHKFLASVPMLDVLLHLMSLLCSWLVSSRSNCQDGRPLDSCPLGRACAILGRAWTPALCVLHCWLLKLKL